MAEVSPSLAKVFEQQREQYNARFARARHLHRRLSAEAFTQVLRGHLLPIAEEVARIAPEKLEQSVSTLYDTVLGLTALDLLGPSSHLATMDEAFARLLPQTARLIAIEPSIVPALANAVYNLAMERSADARRWIAMMANLSRLEPTAAQYLAAGTVAAWVCGMAHYRKGALEAAAGLPAEMLRSILELEGTIAGPELLRLLQDPWWRPGTPPTQDRRLRLVGRAGGFVGFDGPFVEPPEVARFGGRLYALDRREAWVVHADTFGEVLVRYGTNLPDGDPEAQSWFHLERRGQVSRGDQQAHFPDLANWSSFAADEHTLVVTLPRSHYLFFVALA